MWKVQVQKNRCNISVKRNMLTRGFFAEANLTMRVSPNFWKFVESNSSTLKEKVEISGAVGGQMYIFDVSGNITDFENEPKPLQIEADVVMPEEENSHFIIDSQGKNIDGMVQLKQIELVGIILFLFLGMDKFSKNKPIFTKHVYNIKDERPYAPSCNGTCNPEYILKMTLGTPG
jgi:hypothetical protein